MWTLCRHRARLIGAPSQKPSRTPPSKAWPPVPGSASERLPETWQSQPLPPPECQGEGTRAAQLVAKVPARWASPGTGPGAAGALRVLDGNRQSEGGSQKGCLEQCSPTGAAAAEGSWAGVLAWTWSRHPRARRRFPSSVVARGSAFGFDCGRALPSPGSRHPSRAAIPALLVGPQEPGHLGAQ